MLDSRMFSLLILDIEFNIDIDFDIDIDMSSSMLKKKQLAYHS